MRVAAIDIGTNSVLLLVAEAGPAGLSPVVERAEITRLGQGVDGSRALAPEAVQRTLACLGRYGEELRALGVTAIDVVGTSAMRDAAGGDAFRARAAELVGAEPRTISGEEEAELTFRGALAGLSLPPAPVFVFDIGGGSTEVIVGELGGAITSAVSLDVGSVRMTERHLRSDPPRDLELDAVRADVRAALRGAPLPRGPVTIVGVAGTITTLAAVALRVAPYDAARIHGARLTFAELSALRAELASVPVAQRMKLPGLEPKRADVIVAGAVVAEEVLRAVVAAGGAAPELVVSDRGVRWGLALRLAEGSRPS